MWEPDGGNSNNITNNRGVILLLTVLSFCVLLYKTWGPLLFITCALVLVIHTCYSLLVNDSLLAPTLVLLRYTKELSLELVQTVKLLASLIIARSKEIIKYLKQRYEERKRRLQREQQQAEEEDMNRRHRNVYRLSTTGTDLPEQVSPINKDRYHNFVLNGACDSARTSTPLPKGATWGKNTQQNGDIGLFLPSNNSPIKKPPSQRSENRQPSSLTMPRNEDTMYSPKGSPWSNSISPRIKDKSLSVRTVQTVAGPLLASTRYNIDPKIYSDVSSPGFTSRLTKYASEANNKLTHQSQYGTGQFPKVNLNASPIPLLSPKVARARIPVTVRVAPPEMINYPPPDSHPHQEKSKTYSSSSPSDVRESKSCPSVAQVLKEISLKRHASREDIMIDLAKKQRTERVSEDQLENLEEMMQKRARDDSMTSDEDLSPQSKTQRPTKRPKASSCHDILNSLSSSIHVLSGVKRKAMDSSRCSTPDIEKHFKPSSKSPTISTTSIVYSSGEPAKSKEQLNVKVPIASVAEASQQYKIHEKSQESTNINKCSPEENQTDSPKTLNPPIPKIHKEIAAPKATKLTEKLFMRAEPQHNEKLKTLIEEQENVDVKFSIDDKDEIKKQDIVNMRQNSMRARLQSMFNAISGKSDNKIDPDVVIQAEEVNPPSSSTFTALSSLTSTTTVNTSPITTTIVPILKTDSDNKLPTTKHVTFNLPSASSSFSSTTSSLSNQDTIKAPELKPAASKNSGFGFNAIISSAPSFNFQSNTVTSSNTFTSSSPSIAQTTAATSTAFSLSNTTTATLQNTEVKNTTNTSSSSSLFSPKSTSDNLNTTTIISSSGFSFGAKPTSNSTTPSTSSSAISFSSAISPITTKTTESSFGSSGNFNFGNALSKSPASTSIAQTKTAVPSFGSEKKETSGFSFGTPTVANSNTTTSSQVSPIFGTPTTSTPNFSIGSTAAVTSSTAPTTSSTAAFSFGAGATVTNKPGGTFSFGSTTTSNSPAFGASSTTSTPTFGASSTSSTPAFGVSSTNSTPIFGATTTTSTPTFGAITTSSAPTFGAITTTSAPTFGAITTTSAPTFGAATANSTPTFGVSTSSSAPIFGASTSNSASASTFGPPAASNTAATTTTSGFGTSTSTIFGAAQSTFGSSLLGPAPNFKAPSTAATTTTASSIFGGQSNTPTFGVPITTTTSTPSLFGNAAIPASNSTTSTIPNLFANATSPVVTSTATPTIPSFGNTTTQQQSGSIFGGTNSAATTATPSIFGSTTSASTGLFSGNANPSPATSNMTFSSTPAESSNIFGQSKPPASISFGATSSTFGSTNPSSTFSAPNSSSGASAFQIGNTASSSGSLPSFNTIKPTPQFGAPTTQTNSGSSIFGSSTTGGFGTSPNATPAFGSTPAASTGFGMQNNASTTQQPPAFGANPSSGFGNTPAATSPFGVQTATTASSLFGNTVINTVTTGGSFSFGAAQQQPQQPTASFSFGGAPNAGTSNSGGIFQFGASSAAKPAGFNFNAPTSTPAINFTGSAPGAVPTFNAPATNMFSIGSGGSSTPRSRTGRRTGRQR